MKKNFIIKLIIISLFAANLSSQEVREYNVFSYDSDISTFKKNEINILVEAAVILKIENAVLERLYENKNDELIMNIPFKNNQTVAVKLHRIDILSADAKIIERTAEGNREVALTNPIVSYTGKIIGDENTFVVMNFSRNNITGFISNETGNIVLGKLSESYGADGRYILYNDSKLKNKPDFMCGINETMSFAEIEKMRNAIASEMNDKLTNDILVANIALDIDYATYLSYQSSVTNAQNYALALISAVSGLYMKEVNIKLVVSYIRVWTTADPYTGTNSNQVLTRFRNEWVTNQQSVERTLAHLISVRGGNLGGIAYLDVLCNYSNGYGFSNTSGPIFPLPQYVWDVMVVAHELGHNFGSPHTHSCTWPGGQPLDSCYQTEGGCYTGPPVARVGTIMSYCHLNGSISFVSGFGPLPGALIRSNAESANCVSIWNRPIAVAYPNGNEILKTGTNIQIYWGTSLTGNVNIEFSSNNGSSWQTIQNNVLASLRILDWTIPYVNSLQSKIRILNSSNPNEADTCDASFRIVIKLENFNVVSPPTLTRIAVSSSDPLIQKFIWNSTGSDPSIRYKFKLRKFGTPNDYVWTSDNNGADTAISFRKSFLDTLAQTLGTNGDSVRCTWKAWAFNGYDSTSSLNTFIVTLVRTTVGINMISTIIPDKFNLENNYPNPFNPSTKIKFDIPKSSFVELKIFDLNGREVSSLVNEKLEPGSYEYNWDAANLPSGAYFYRLKTSNFTDTKRMVLLK